MNPFEFFEAAQAKQHINLSNQAWDIIEQDIVEFQNAEPDKISGFLNHILEIYLQDGLYPADITTSIQAYEKKQLAWLSSIPGLEAAQRNAILAPLKEEYISTLLQTLRTTKGIGRKFDINTACRRLLKERGDHGYEAALFQKRGSYINAILESYASLPMAEREDIYYSALITELDYCIAKNRVIHLTGAYRSEPLVPYKIMHDKYNLHTYLIAVPYDTKEYQSRLFRISQIQKVERTGLTAPPLTKETAKLIESEIKQKGVQFLPGETQLIRIRLTPAGQSMYRRVTFQRPVFDTQTPEEDGSMLFTFSCTPFQAYVYFRSFGAEAEILEPETLRQDFIHFYDTSLQAYKK